MSSAAPIFTFPENESSSASKRVRAAANEIPHVQTVIAGNPNLTAMMMASPVPSANQQQQQHSEYGVDNLVESLENLGLGVLERKEMQRNAQANAYAIKQKKEEQLKKEKEKLEKKEFEKVLKDSNALVLKYLLNYAQRYQKPDLQVKVGEILYTIDWPEKKPVKVDDAYVKQYMKEALFQHRVALDSHQRIDDFVNNMFSDGERMRFAKETKAKPKLKILKDSEKDVFKMIALDELMKVSNENDPFNHI